MINKLVLNFIGPPASGKTVAATSIFGQFKRMHLNCAVYVPEYATEKAIEQNKTIFQNQLAVWAQQQYRIFCAYHHTQIVVTDSPILLGAIYNSDNPDLCKVVLNEHRKYNNLNIMMELNESYPYSMTGRVHSFTQSMQIQHQIIGLLESEEIPFMYYNQTSEEEIIQLVCESLEL